MREIRLNIDKEQFKKKLNIKDGVDGKKGDIGPKGKDGKNGKDGKDGKNGKNGKDGSPDTGEQIVKKVNDLEITPKKQIDIKHIKGLDKFWIENYPKIIPSIGGGVEEAPIDGKQYARKNATWKEVDTLDLSDYAKLVIEENPTPVEEGMFSINPVTNAFRIYYNGEWQTLHILSAGTLYYLLQENGDFLLQENGDKIIL